MAASVIIRMGRWSRIVVASAICASVLTVGIAVLINSRSPANAQVAPIISAPATTDGVATDPSQQCDLDTVGLRGIREIRVGASVIGVATDDFPQQEVAQRVQDWMVKQGIKVTSSKDVDVPQFIVVIEAHNEAQTGLVMFGVGIGVVDRVRLKRSPDILSLVTTYDRRTNGVASRELVVDMITGAANELLERFQKDFSAEHRVATPEN